MSLGLFAAASRWKENAGWLLGERVAKLGVGLVVGVWVARYLGPERLGVLSFALAFASLFSALAGVGLDGILVRDLINDPQGSDLTLGSAFLLRLLGGVAALFLCLGAVFWLYPRDPEIRVLVAIASAGSLFQTFECIDLWFQSQQQSRAAVIARSIAFAIAALLRVALILAQAPLLAFALAALLELGLAALGLAIAYRASGRRLWRWRATAARALALFKDSAPLILSAGAIMIYMRIDQVMLGQMASTAEVGIYSAAVRLAELWYFVPVAVVASLFPEVLRARQESEALFLDKLQRLYNLMAFLGYAVAVPTTLFAGTVVRLLYGPAFARSAPMLALLIWAGLFTNLGVARSAFLTAMNWNSLHLATVALGAAVNVALNFLLIPRYGGMGAVIATCVAYWFAAHGASLLLPRLRSTGCMLTRALVYPRIW